jgi:HPt (histidine-containing phosphotransfer) domain-containing protein
MSELYANQDLDLSLLKEIADGSDEFLIETIEMFLDQTPKLLTVIDNSIVEMDWVTVGSSAHKLKPTLGFFGMLNTQALIQDVELSSKGGASNPVDIIAKFKQVKENIDTNIITLKRLKEEVQSRL